METALVLNVHSDSKLILDTLSSVLENGIEKIMMIIDGASSDEFKETPFPVPKVIGYPHGVARSPYKNMALGLKLLHEQHPDCEWYCYAEADCLWASSRFKKSLELASQQGIWMMGTNGRIDHVPMPLLESLINEQFRSVYYMLGACLFFHKDFLNKLEEINFFDRFLHMTSDFSPGQFPQYEGYDINEHMYPTLARHFGGNIGVFSTYMDGEWHGSYKVFPIRWKPELDPETENFDEASILHPVKDINNPIRIYHREKRCSLENPEF